jgi:hypothetical protein
MADTQKVELSPRSNDMVQSYKNFAKKDEIAFTLGVVNLCFSSWLVGAYPQCFWLYHMIKIPVLLSYKLYLNSFIKKQFFLLDYCYVVNYFSVIYYALCLMKANIPALEGANGINWLGPIAFRCLFTQAVGPMAMAIPAFRNSLVLHDWNQVAVLATHWSPNIALWGMRWWPTALEKSFPDTFHIECENLPSQLDLFFSKDDCHGTFLEMWATPIASYLLLWAIPYTIFIFYCGAGMIERGGYITMYDDMKDHAFFKWWLATCGGGTKAFKYMLAHWIACSLAMLMGPLLWHSFALHTTYLLLIFIVSIHNGGTYYFRVFAKRYYKDKMDVAAQSYEKKLALSAGGVITPEPQEENHPHGSLELGILATSSSSSSSSAGTGDNNNKYSKINQVINISSDKDNKAV